MLLRHVKIQMYLPKLLKKIPTYLQTLFILRLMPLSIMVISDPVFKKDSKNSKDNYRPISILKNISKLYERILFKQIRTFMDIFFFQNSNAVLEKVIVHSNVYLHQLKNGSLRLITASPLVRF